jgi:hypothetical protein
VFAVNVGINDPIENVRDMVAAQVLTMPVAYDRDGGVAESMQLSVTPQHVVIDAAGIVRHIGHAITPQLERAIVAALETPSRQAAPTSPRPALAAHSALATARAPIALTFATLFCDEYIADSRPEIGAACAAHARQVEQLHRPPRAALGHYRVSGMDRR